jgi:hypothetical protein
MACLFSTSPNIAAFGPRITVLIRPSLALLKSLTDPVEIAKYSKVFSATMLIDTGASCSAIDVAIAPFLGLTNHGTSKIQTPSGEKDHLTFDIDLNFTTHNYAINNLRVVEADLKTKQGIDGLIGRDVLKNALLVYQGWANQYTLAF